MKLIHDLRLAWRGLVKSPELATIIIGTLALGIGASTAIFSVVDGVLLEPLTFAEPKRVVTVWGSGRNFPQIPISSGDFKDIREMTDAVGDYSARWSQQASLTGDGVEPEEISVGWVTPNYFALLGIQPSLGRTFEPEEGDAVVLSHALWTRRFGADPDILDRRLEIGGDPSPRSE